MLGDFKPSWYRCMYIECLVFSPSFPSLSTLAKDWCRLKYWITQAVWCKMTETTVAFQGGMFQQQLEATVHLFLLHSGMYWYMNTTKIDEQLSPDPLLWFQWGIRYNYTKWHFTPPMEGKFYVGSDATFPSWHGGKILCGGHKIPLHNFARDTAARRTYVLESRYVQT